MTDRPKGLGRTERLRERRSASQMRRVGGVVRSEPAHDHTGAFGSFRRPKLKGVSDVVAASNREMARRARKAEKAWLRTL